MFFRHCDERAGEEADGALYCDVGTEPHGGENSWFFRSGYNNPGETPARSFKPLSPFRKDNGTVHVTRRSNPVACCLKRVLNSHAVYDTDNINPLFPMAPTARPCLLRSPPFIRPPVLSSPSPSSPLLTLTPAFKVTVRHTLLTWGWPSAPVRELPSRLSCGSRPSVWLGMARTIESTWARTQATTEQGLTCS